MDTNPDGAGVYPEGLRKAATNPDDGYPERDGGEEVTIIIEKLG